MTNIVDFLNMGEKKIKIWKAAAKAVHHFNSNQHWGKGAALFEKGYINKSESRSGESTWKDTLVNFSSHIILRKALVLALSHGMQKGAGPGSTLGQLDPAVCESTLKWAVQDKQHNIQALAPTKTVSQL